LIALAQLAHRAPPVQREAFFFDFSNVYSASRAWLAGQNPYDIDAVHRAWDQSHPGRFLGKHEAVGLRDWAAVHPPSTLILLSPLAMLNAVPAHLIWMTSVLGLMVASFFALFSLSGIAWPSGRMLLVACALASAPIQCAIESGQPALPSAAMVILAVWAFSKDRQFLAGVLLGLATCVKLQMGLPFVAYYLFIRQWRIASVASLVFAVATLAAITRMETMGYSNWWLDWHKNIALTLEPGQVNDPRPGGPWRNDMVNLQTLIDVVLHAQVAIDFCVLFVFIPLLTGFLARVRPTKAAGQDLLALSLVSLLSMLPLYHRLYDGCLLMMLLAWALGRVETRQRGSAIVVLLLLGEFLVPIDLVPFVLRRTHVFDSLISTHWWQGLVVPHHAWGVLAISLGALYAFVRRGQPILVLRTPLQGNARSGSARPGRIAA
jgi:hypothetical protein